MSAQRVAGEGPAEDDLCDEALAWIMRLHGGGAGSEAQAGFRRWRGQSAGHEAAAREAEAVWSMTSLVHRDRETGRIEPGREVRRVARRDVLRGIAGLAVLGGGTLGGVRLSRGIRSDLVTGVAERSRMALAGQGEVILNAWTALDAGGTPQDRQLTLHEGQASLRLSGGRAAVRAGPLRVLATGAGTVDVNRNMPRGQIAVASLGTRTLVQGDHGQAQEVPAGARVVFDRAGLPLSHAPDAAAAALAWQQGELVAEAMPLEEVVSALRPWSHGWITIADGKLAEMKVNAVLDLEDPARALDALALGLPLRLHRVGDVLTVLVSG